MLGSRSKVCLAIAAASLLGACSGGGGGDSSGPTSPPASPPPTSPPPGGSSVVQVDIDTPVPGQMLGAISFTVSGDARNADSVTVSLDGGAEVTASGTDDWSVEIDASSAGLGAHTLTARAVGAAGEDVFTLPFEIIEEGDHPRGAVTTITYNSSVDGAPLSAELYLPPNLDVETDGPVPLMLWLHGGGADGTFPGFTREHLEERRWIGIAPRGREWNVPGCGWDYSAAYVNNPNPNVGPGEQDALDAMAWVQENYVVDPDRVVLMGFSMGGRGTYSIGLKNPDLFAAIVPFAPVTDNIEIWTRVNNDVPCFEGIAGGAVGDSPTVDTTYKMTSGRFLIENAHNVPVYHGHGTLDQLVFNIPPSDDYLHGFHMTTDTSWDGCHDGDQYCYGHTPTLSELSALHPDGYDWAYMFTPIADPLPHTVDRRWLSGTTPGTGDFGTPDPNAPGQLLGVFDFLADRPRNREPDRIVYKTYTDTHERSHWLSLASATPWQDQPAAVRAARNRFANTLDIELARADILTVDLDLADLTLRDPLTVDLTELVEPVFDPALAMDAGESLTPTLTFEGDFAGVTGVRVERDNQELAASLVTFSNGRLSIGPLVVDGATELTITPVE